MKKEVINEINEMRKMMGLQEQGFVNAIKKGFQKGKESVNGIIDKVKEKIGTSVDEKGNEINDSTEKYNGTPVSDIIKQIYDTKDRSGKIDINGETLYFGVGSSKNSNSAISQSDFNARSFMSTDTGEQVQKGVGHVIQKMRMDGDGNYVSYVCLKQF